MWYLLPLFDGFGGQLLVFHFQKAISQSLPVFDTISLCLPTKYWNGIAGPYAYVTIPLKSCVIPQDMLWTAGRVGGQTVSFSIFLHKNANFDHTHYYLTHNSRVTPQYIV